MSYFQNPFAEEFRGNWVLADRQASLVFSVPANSGRGAENVVSWKDDEYNLSGNDASGNAKKYLKIMFAMAALNFKNWAEISVNVEGATAGRTTAYEIVSALNASAQFSGYFVANVVNNRVFIKQKLPVTHMKFYVENGGAEQELRFNARAGVAELPTYFMRHTVGERYRNVFPDALNMLVYLNPSGWTTLGTKVEGDVIKLATDAKGNSLNLDPTTIQADYKLLKGRSGLFMFYKNTLDSNSPKRISSQVQYQAGAVAGDLAKKIYYTYDGTSTTILTQAETPYVLVDADLITP